MFKRSTGRLVLLALCVAVLATTQAAVIRTESEEGGKKVEETTTEQVTTEESDVTTVKDDDVTTTSPLEDYGALSRDEEASILLIDQTLLDPAPSERQHTPAATVQVEKSAKLLLLSAPKLAEKPKIPEENIEESEELEDTAGNTTDSAVETTTVQEQLAEETTTVAFEAEEKAEQLTEAVPTTKLFPINDTLYEDQTKNNSQDAKEPPVVVVDEEPKEVKNSNFGAIVLTESEADYVVVEGDAEVFEEGVYADIDSELHLQPIVQSVEIVPSSVDDQLLVNYVHSW